MTVFDTVMQTDSLVLYEQKTTKEEEKYGYHKNVHSFFKKGVYPKNVGTFCIVL